MSTSPEKSVDDRPTEVASSDGSDAGRDNKSPSRGKSVDDQPMEVASSDGSDAGRDNKNPSREESADDQPKDVVTTIVAPRIMRTAARVGLSKLQNKPKVKADVKAEDPDESDEDEDEPAPQKRKKAVDFDFPMLLADPSFDKPHMYRRMQPEHFTMDYYHKSGFKEVILFECDPERLGMKMMRGPYTVHDVARHVGEDKVIAVVNVETAQSVSMPLKQFVAHYITPNEDKKELYNVLSLEFSNTTLAELVTPPALIQQIDWGSLWPDPLKMRNVEFDRKGFHASNWYPRVENFCLMSPTQCYTDFHIDFHGSSVWYHVKTGKKIFWIMRPTAENMALYEQYDIDGTGFFGYQAKECARVEVLPGNTLILPAGWIHAVFTPEDSLVFGGNFLHTRAIVMQLEVLKGEARIGVDKKFRYPYSDEVVLFVINHIVKSTTGREYVRPASRNQQDYWMEYVGDLFMQCGHHRRVPTKRDYVEDGKAWVPRYPETAEYKAMVKKFAPFEKTIKEEVKDPYFEEKMEDEEDEEGRGWKKKKKRPESEDKPIFGDYNDWFIDKTTFYHPESFGIDLGRATLAVHTYPISAKEPPMVIDQDRLRKMIHPKMITELEHLVVHYTDKPALDMPPGLTRPNSLMNALIVLLRKRRWIATEVEGVKLPKCVLPDKEKMRQLHEKHYGMWEERKRRRDAERAKDKDREEEKDKRQTDGEEDSDYEEPPKKKKQKKEKQETKSETKKDTKSLGMGKVGAKAAKPAPGYFSFNGNGRPAPSTASASANRNAIANRAPFSGNQALLARPVPGRLPASMASTAANPFPLSASLGATPFSSRTWVPSHLTDTIYAAPVVDASLPAGVPDKSGIHLYFELTKARMEQLYSGMTGPQQWNAWKGTWDKMSATEKKLYESRRCLVEFHRVWETVRRAPVCLSKPADEMAKAKERLMAEWIQSDQKKRDAHLAAAGYKPISQASVAGPSKGQAAQTGLLGAVQRHVARTAPANTTPIPRVAPVTPAAPATLAWPALQTPNFYVDRTTGLISLKPLAPNYSAPDNKPDKGDGQQ